MHKAPKAAAKAVKPKVSGKRGRPSAFTDALAQEICDRLSKGEPLAAMCRSEGMPHPSTVRDWQERDEAFSLAIARARELGHDAIAAEALEIADDDSRDWEMIKDDNGVVTGIRIDGEHVQRSKLRIDTRLKLLAKWDPKRYGDKVQNEHSGPNGAPIATSLTVSFV